MMKEYNDFMGCSKNEYDHLNDVVDNINKHLGKEVFRLESTPEGYENECVDIYENDQMNSSYMSFEDAITYLEGVETGVLLKEEYAV